MPGMPMMVPGPDGKLPQLPQAQPMPVQQAMAQAKAKAEPAPPKEPPKPNVPQGFLHKKPSAKCKNCERYRVAMEEWEKNKETAAQEAKVAHTESDTLELTNTQGYNFSKVLIDQILKSPYFKTLVAH